MASDVDGQTPDQFAAFFQRRVGHSVRHWQTFVAEQQANTTALEQSQSQILRAISFALASEAAWPATRPLIETFAPYMERRGYWDTWHELLSQALTAAQRFDDTAGQITLMALLARLLQRQSRVGEAIHHYRRVIRLARRTANRFEEARACSNLGYLYTDSVNRWWRANILCCRALTIFESLDSQHGQAHTHNHLGILYTRQHLWEPAETHLKRACQLWQGMGDDHSLVRGFTNLGMLYFERENPYQALSFLHKALHQTELTKEEAESGTILMNLGIAYMQNGNLKKAEIHVKQAESIFQRYANSLGLAQSADNLGLIYFQQEKWAEAIQYMQASLKMYRYLRNRDGEIKALLSLVDYKLARKNQEQAINHLDELETVIVQHSRGEQEEYLQARLEKYRRRLAKQSV